jgi:hypothetical protein
VSATFLAMMSARDACRSERSAFRADSMSPGGNRRRLPGPVPGRRRHTDQANHDE